MLSIQIRILLFILAMNQLFLFAGGEVYPVGSRQAGMGRTGTTLTDLWSIQNNQAGIALIDKTSFGIYYENLYFVDGLGKESAAVVYPANFGVLGLSFNYFGNSLYSDIKVGLAYARSFGPYFRIGLQLDYLQLTLGENYGKQSNFTFELGIQSDVTETLTIGASVFNPIMVSLAEYDEENIPAVFRFGLGWQVSKDFLVTIDAEKSTNYAPVILRAGVEYGIREKFFMRCGFTTYQEIFTMGFGIELKSFRFNLSAVMHQSLGFSLQSGLIFQIGKKK